jgi:hypothetical protein
MNLIITYPDRKSKDAAVIYNGARNCGEALLKGQSSKKRLSLTMSLSAIHDVTGRSLVRVIYTHEISMGHRQ